MKPSVVFVDALAHGDKGRRMVTVDVIGAGPRTVAGVLEMHNINVELYTAEKVLENPNILRGFDALFISGMSIDEKTVARVIKYWRRINPNRLVVVGGPIASDPQFLTRVGGDLGVYGEAEPVIDNMVVKGLLELKPSEIAEVAKQICGTVYLEGNKLMINRRCPIMPRRVWERYKPSTSVIEGYPMFWASRVYVEVVRGCSNYTFPDLKGVIPDDLLPDKPKPGCAYCSVIPLYGYARSRSIEHVVREVKELISHGVKRIVLSGPDFLDYGRDWLVEPQPLVNPRKPPPNIDAIHGLLKELHNIPEISSGETSIMIENVKPSLVNEHVGQVLGEFLRGTPVHIGAETGDNVLLLKLGRPATTYETIRAVRILRKYGLHPYVYIMYCLPGETDDVIKRTLEYMEKLYNAGAEKFTAYKFTPLPLSYLEKLVGRWKPRCPSPHPVRLKAEELNRRAKKRLLGRIVRVIVVSIHPRFKKPIGYPMPHGPVILLDRGSRGDIVEARITGVIGDRMVEGTVIRFLTNILRN
jgi:radical SAM superfamily enzyme YgiQ (UPF0313 family)